MRQRKHNKINSFICVLLIACMSMAVAACSQEEPQEKTKPADYGSYGLDMAVEIANTWPNRSPGTAQERETAEFIEAAFADLGYEPEVNKFTYQTEVGEVYSSQNIVVNIDGQGFEVEAEDGSTTSVRRRVIVGAHYDVAITSEQSEAARLENEQTQESTTESETTQTQDETGETQTDGSLVTLFTEVELPMPTLAEFDGIHNNASGIGALLTLAKELTESQFGYDITLVAFGAANAGFSGSRAYAAEIDADDLEMIDVMYNIDGIYAGDKVYAHAGQNSVLGSDKKLYEMRRKLYEATDIYYENELYTNNRFALYTNQSGIKVPWGAPESQQFAVYREWTQRQSDHTPFDELGIPVVFFESYDYDADSLEEMRESNNPSFAATEGVITATAFDSYEYLSNLFAHSETMSANSKADSIDLLTRRINNVAFIIRGGIAKGVHNAVSEE